VITVYDVIIENGTIVDGSGNPWFYGDIGVKAGKISRIGCLREHRAVERIDGRGLMVCPGFIDIHCHSDGLIFRDPPEQGKVLQGVTTETIGNCGISLAPTSHETLELLKKYTAAFCAGVPLAWNWHTVGDYLRQVEAVGSITNAAALVGHGTIRIAVMGFDDRKPTGEEMVNMKRLVAEALADGAFGMSSGLIYPPGLFSTTDELVELCKVVAAEGGIYTTHMRGETDMVLDSVKEALEIGRKSGVSVEISHHKTAGRDNWGKSRQTLELVEAARRDGIDVTCDVYPYTAANTMLGALLPPWMHEGGTQVLLTRLKEPENRRRIKRELITSLPGWENYAKASGWENIYIASSRKATTYEGKSMQEIADVKHIDPAEAMFDLMIETEGDVLMTFFMMCEDDVSYIMRHPAVMVASDAIPSTGKPHPRYFGTFPRVLGKYVRKDNVLPLEEGIRKMTSMPAQKLGLRNRGLLKEGMWADITVFDPRQIEDKATYQDPQQYAVGIKYVLVNGKFAVREGKYTGAKSGQVLRREE
jgi:N-acyl-D-amino-acid deacylase